jgi:hypothetical protein
VTPELFFDTRTGTVDPAVWQRWLDWDPVRMAAGRADALRSLHSIWIDAGTRDDYFLDVGAEAFVVELRRIGIGADVLSFELFDATHSAIDYRYPLSLAWLCRRMATK